MAGEIIITNMQELKNNEGSIQMWMANDVKEDRMSKEFKCKCRGGKDMIILY